MQRLTREIQESRPPAVPLALFVILILTFVESSAHAQDYRERFDTMLRKVVDSKAENATKSVPKTKVWLQATNKVIFEYHSRVKYGKRVSVFSTDPEQIEAKWKKIDIAKQPDPVLRFYFSERKWFESFLQKESLKRRDALFWFFVRGVAGSLGGDDVRELFDALPDGLPQKQNADSVLSTLFASGVSIRVVSWCMERLRVVVREKIQSRYGNDSKDILELFDAPYNPVILVKEESKWLKANRPALLNRIEVESSRRVATAKQKIARYQQVAKLLSPTYEKTFARSYGKYSSRREWYARLARIYEAENVPQLAAPVFEKQVATFWPAFREAMVLEASRLESQKQVFEAMHALRLATILEHVSRRVFGSREKPRLIVSLTDQRVLDQHAKLGQQLLGFLGSIQTFEPIQQIELAAGGTKLVLLAQTGLEIYDLKTGKQLHRIFDPLEKHNMMRMAVAPMGSSIYVIDDSPIIRRYSIATGKRDTKFNLPVPRKDVIIAVSPKEDRLAIAHITKTGIFNLRRNKAERVIAGLSNRVVSFTEFSQDGKFILQGGNDPRFDFYSVRTGRSRLTSRIRPRGNYYVRHALDTADGYIACAGVGGFTVWKKRKRSPILSVQVEGTDFGRIELTPGGKFAITPYGIWDLSTSKNILPFNLSTVGKSLRMTSDGKRIAFFSGKTVFVVPTLLN